MKLFEIFNPSYAVKRVSQSSWDVAKFRDRKEPEAVYRVEERNHGKFWTDCPGFVHKRQEEKHILIVKQFIKDGEPELTGYQINDSGKITSRKFGS